MAYFIVITGFNIYSFKNFIHYLNIFVKFPRDKSFISDYVAKIFKTKLNKNGKNIVFTLFIFITFVFIFIFLNQNSGRASATSKLSPLSPEPYDRAATVDIPLDSSKVHHIMKMLKEMSKLCCINVADQIYNCVNFYL